MPNWYSVGNLRKAWNYAKLDMKDDFVFDIIEHWDVTHSIDKVLEMLSAQLARRQYHPAGILALPVPKSHHSFRPGTTIPIVDFIVLYAVAQQLAPPLDKTLSNSVYAYRLNPHREDRNQPLFQDKQDREEENQREAQRNLEEVEEENYDEIAFPYNWFQNWLIFHRRTRIASQEYEHVAVTDIAAYFENISHQILIDRMRECLGEEHRGHLDQLCSLLSYWDWATSVSKVDGKGLPQGNDVSSFLSNIYLRDLDEAMLEVVDRNPDKYFRYVDDIRIYTSDEDEARQALVRLEQTLRTLGLNTQTAKTEIKPASAVFDPDVTEWMEQLEQEQDERLEVAVDFIDRFDLMDPGTISKYQRVYRRALTILGQANNDAAVNVALNMLLENPSIKVLSNNFRYLRRFSTTKFYENRVSARLTEDRFTFDYHRAYMYRLASYSRGDEPNLYGLAINDALNVSQHWFVRVGAYLYLSTCPIEARDLTQILRATEQEGNVEVARAQYVTLCQYSGNQLRDHVLERVSYFNAPYQDYLRRYFFRLVKREDTADGVLTAVNRQSIESPFFIRHLHQLDLIKANRYVRPKFREVLEAKIAEVDDRWPRLQARLAALFESFVDKP